MNARGSVEATSRAEVEKAWNDAQSSTVKDDYAEFIEMTVRLSEIRGLTDGHGDLACIRRTGSRCEEARVSRIVS